MHNSIVDALAASKSRLALLTADTNTSVSELVEANNLKSRIETFKGALETLIKG